MATIHLISGPVGAGKTTWALRLAAETGPVHFSIDEWMATLFWMDAPAAPDLPWALARVARCEAQIWVMCRQLCARGVDVLLDLGFWKREQRDRFRALAAQAGVPVKLHYITADREVRRERVRQRNRGSATFTVEVSDSTFDWSEGEYEVPGEDELHGANVVWNQ